LTEKNEIIKYKKINKTKIKLNIKAPFIKNIKENVKNNSNEAIMISI